jgi:hypothetical protein
LHNDSQLVAGEQTARQRTSRLPFFSTCPRLKQALTSGPRGAKLLIRGAIQEAQMALPYIGSQYAAGICGVAAVIALVMAIPHPAKAQSPRRGVNSKTAIPTRHTDSFANAPTVEPPAQSDESRNPANIVVKTEWQLERERVLAMRQASRDAAKARREATWASLPVKYYTDEDLAQSKYSIARQLWRCGRVDRSRLYLEQLIADFPFTETADRAKIVLTRF